MTRAALCLVALAHLCVGCATTSGPGSQPAHRRDARGEAVRQTHEDVAPDSPKAQADDSDDDAPAAPAVKVVRDARGRPAIRRAELKRLVRYGAQNFVALLRVGPTFRAGRFYGWRILEYRGPGRLAAGDVVLRVNGASVERPEQFMAVWEHMAQRKDLIVDLLHRGRPQTLAYAIID